MRELQQVPRNALVWIIISQFALLALHLGRVPLWIIAVYVFAAVWRIMVYQGRWSFPGWKIKAALISFAFVGIFASYRSLIGLEPTVALLLTAFALKLIELASRKDGYVLLFLGYFICITEFLFSQDILVVFFSFINVALVTTALVALHQPGEHQFNRKSARLAFVMLLQALPLMVILFFLFPRIGPLWTVPIKSHTARTGVSDFMKPGDISQLSQSADVAFRVQFEGEIPPRSELYWRGLVFSRLEDGAWRSLKYFDLPPGQRRPVPIETDGESLRYTVIMEPTQQNWLYSLRYAEGVTAGIMETSDFLLYSPVIVEDEYLYRVESWPQVGLEFDLGDWRRNTELKLPPAENPQTLQLARDMRARADSDADFAQSVLSHFNTQPFVYTLQPLPLQDFNAMDQFMFQTRRGFCEHYAYAFVVMMRAAGVPARVVAGYQGGEVNPVNKTVIVHQFDAHAWAEVWLEGEGWVRFDPTASVSPDRIEWGLERAMQEEGSFLANSPLSPLRYRSINWVNNLRLRYDALTYRWQSWVVGFDSERQFELLQDIFGTISARKFAALLIGGWALVLLPVGISLLLGRERQPLSAIDKCYLQFCAKLQAAGIAREPGEAPGDFAARASSAIPAVADQVEHINRLYGELAYADGSGSAADGLLREMRSAVARFRPRAASGATAGK